MEESSRAEQALDRIEERLVAHADTLDAHILSEERWQRDTATELHRIDTALRGNGKLGINTRLDRVEQREKGRTKITWVAVAAGFGSILSWAARHWK